MSSNTALTVIPTKRKGRSRSQINGYMTSANRASGQHKTNSTHHKRKLNIGLCPPRLSGPILIRSRLTSVANLIATIVQILDTSRKRYIGEVDDNPLEFPIDGTLDLHTFSPKDVESLVPEYIQECLSRGVLHLRIVHGKGTGTLRRLVHSILDEHPAVVSYRHEGGSGGSWGATVVDLRSVTGDRAR